MSTQSPLTLEADNDGQVWVRLHQEGKMDIIVAVQADSEMHRFLLALINVLGAEQ